MILGIGNSGSYELEAFQSVLTELRKNGHDAILFRQDKCLEKDFLSFEIKSNRCLFFVYVDGKKDDVNNFYAIWYMKPMLPDILLNFNPPEYRQLLAKSFLQMRKSIWFLFGHKNWINNPLACDTMENKILQLKIASEVGFHIPDTVITYNPDDVRDFYKKNQKKIIVKLLTSSSIKGKIIGTNIVKSGHLDKIDSVKMSPSIFQALILKEYELRITIVGKKIFAAKIYSQGDEGTSIDWRRKPKVNDFDVRMETTRLPPEIENLVFKFMERSGLKFGCIDMIFTPDKKYVFLEINPNGQWYFVQLRTGEEIALAIADLLIFGR